MKVNARVLFLSALFFVACSAAEEEPRLEYYQIEGDIPVSYEEYQRYQSGIGLSISAATVNTVSGNRDIWVNGEQHNLTYCVSLDFGALHARAVREMLHATGDWEASADIRFIHRPEHDDDCDNTNSAIMFSVRPFSVNNWLGCAFVRSGTLLCESRTLFVNYPEIDEIDPGHPNATSVGVLRHELGHILGLRHEDVRVPCWEEGTWSNVTAFDQRSVMNTFDSECGNLFGHGALTTLDRQAVRRLYGAPHVVYDHRFAPTDHNADGLADIELTGARGWTTLPVAFGQLNNTFNITNSTNTTFADLATKDGVQVLKGDFNGDGRTDLALIGSEEFTGIPLAFSAGDGTYTHQVGTAGSFPGWARADNARAVVGDFNGDGRSDIALLGEIGRTDIPIAFAQSSGNFSVTNASSSIFAGRAAEANVKIVTGYFNLDLFQDIALTGGNSWTTIPTAFSNGNGTFTVHTETVSNFPAWAATEGVDIVAGDFDSDGDTDLALTGGAGWTTIPVARSNGNGTYAVTNNTATTFASNAAVFGAEAFAADFNFDLRSDIVIAGGDGATTIPTALFTNGGAFTTTNTSVTDFPGWAATGAKILAGDFNGDGKADLALTGTLGWFTIPLARSNGFGGFNVSNPAVTGFADWTATSGVWVK